MSIGVKVVIVRTAVVTVVAVVAEMLVVVGLPCIFSTDSPYFKSSVCVRTYQNIN